MFIFFSFFFFFFFFFNDTATTEIYTLSLHDALRSPVAHRPHATRRFAVCRYRLRWRSEEHTSELQSRFDIVCRLLLEKKNTYCISFFFLDNKKRVSVLCLFISIL